MRRFSIFALIVLLLPCAALSARVSSASLGGFYSYGRTFNQDTIQGSTVGVALKGNTPFGTGSRLGLRYDLLAKTAIGLRVDGTAADDLETIGMDLGVGVAYQRPITYISYIEAGLSLRAMGALGDYTYKGTTMVDNHALLGIAAFVDYNHALHNNVIINVGANAQLPFFGYARTGNKSNPSEGPVSIGDIELSPYVGVSYLF